MTIETVDVAKPDAHEVLLNTAYAGLCHSDLHFLEGLYPMMAPAVLGHESSAVVEEVGSEVTYVMKRDRVIICLSVFCGTCEYCTSGRPQHRRVSRTVALSKHFEIDGVGVTLVDFHYSVV